MSRKNKNKHKNKYKHKLFVYSGKKKKNKQGGDFVCPNYENLSNGKDYCKDETSSIWWGECINWVQFDGEGKLKCKGNRNTCGKMRIKWLLTLSDEQRKEQVSQV